MKKFVKNWILEFLDILSILLLLYACYGIVEILKYSIVLFYLGTFLLFYIMIRFSIQFIKKNIERK